MVGGDGLARRLCWFHLTVVAQGKRSLEFFIDRAFVGKGFFDRRPLVLVERATVFLLVESNCDLRVHTTDMYESKNLGGPPLVDLVDQDKILLLDRLGRSGRSKDPKRMHYNKDVREKFIDKGCGYELLPPKGAEFNPCELFNGG